MKNISLMECIEAISLGDMSFNSLKGISFDTTNQDNFYCNRRFAIFKIKIDNKPYKLKISLTQEDDTFEFFKSVDRCNTFYSNMFIQMTNLFDELNIYTDYGVNSYHITLIDDDYQQRYTSKEEFTKQLLRLVSNIIQSNLVVDNFSLSSVVSKDSQLKISLEDNGKIMSAAEILPDMQIAFKNYLVALLHYVDTNFGKTNTQDFLSLAPIFSVTKYSKYNTARFKETYKTNLSERMYNILDSINREFCYKDFLKIAEEDYSPLSIEQATPEIFKKSDIDYKNIVGESQENRIAIYYPEKSKIGFIDFSCKEVIAPQYDTVTDFEEGVSVVSIGTKFGAINPYNEVIIGFDYEDLNWNVQYNIFVACKNGKYGLLTRDGKQICDFEFEWLDSFYFSRARYIDSKTKLFGYINTKGERVIDAKWEEAKIFQNGTAKVQFGGSCYTLDSDGVII